MKRSILFITLAAILLSSCFIPDNYEAEVWVHKDGSYEFFYEGELHYAPAVEKIRNGEFGEEELDDMLDIEEDLFESDGFMDAEYIGDGKFRIDVVMPLMPGEDYHFISEDIVIFSFKHDEDGNLVIKGHELDEDNLAAVRSLGIKMEGELVVRADKGVKIKSNNADQKKKDKKKRTSYIWKLNIDSPIPEMKIKQ